MGDACCLSRVLINIFVSKFLGLGHTDDVYYRKAPAWHSVNWYRNVYMYIFSFLISFSLSETARSSAHAPSFCTVECHETLALPE